MPTKQSKSGAVKPTARLGAFRARLPGAGTRQSRAHLLRASLTQHLIPSPPLPPHNPAAPPALLLRLGGERGGLGGGRGGVGCQLGGPGHRLHGDSPIRLLPSLRGFPPTSHGSFPATAEPTTLRGARPSRGAVQCPTELGGGKGGVRRSLGPRGASPTSPVASAPS